MAAAGFDEVIDIAGALRAKAEILADHQPLHVQALHQDFFDEIFRRQRGEMGIEMFDDDAVHALVGQRLQLVAQAGDAGRRLHRAMS